MSNDAANVLHIDDAPRLGVFQAGVDALANVNAMHDVVPRRVLGKRVDETVRVGSNIG